MAGQIKVSAMREISFISLYRGIIRWYPADNI